ncbi:hypothetical protein KUCAC02_017929, partial [Chaenocephalus aceratus]
HLMSTALNSSLAAWNGVLSTSPEKFWRENAVRLNEKNYELLKILTRLWRCLMILKSSQWQRHDVGEYVRHYPRGKR